MTSLREPGDEPVEHDPTGMRALLRALPEPGPMPDHLVARIQAAMLQEAQGRPAAEEAMGTASGARVLPMAGDRVTGDGIVRGLASGRRPSRLTWLAAAAAVVVFGGLGANAFVHARYGSWSTAFGHSGVASAASSSAAGGSAARGQAGSSPESSSAASDSSAGARATMALSASTVVVATRTAYRSADLSTQAGTLVRSGPTPILPGAAESPAYGPVATPVGATDCAVRAGIPTDGGLLVDVATVDAKPGLVVVTTGSPHIAYALTRTCAIIAGPVQVS